MLATLTEQVCLRIYWNINILIMGGEIKESEDYKV